MKSLITKLLSPLLTRLENSDGNYAYSPSHRKILAVMGILFLGITGVTLYFSLQINQVGAALPVALFGSIGILCLLVAWVGSDKAVAKLWRNRNE